MRLRRDDVVAIIAGDGRGQTGKVLRVLGKDGKVIVQNQSYILKHVKKTRQNPQGGRLQKESPMRVSNVRLICPLCSEKTVAAMRRNEEGKRVRYCKKCDEEI